MNGRNYLRPRPASPYPPPPHTHTPIHTTHRRDELAARLGLGAIDPDTFWENDTVLAGLKGLIDRYLISMQHEMEAVSLEITRHTNTLVNGVGAWPCGCGCRELCAASRRLRAARRRLRCTP